MHGRGKWAPMAPVHTVTKGEFSFLIAFGKQLERALELSYDGSAPDFVVDAVGVLANALEGIAGTPVDDEGDAGGDDDGSDDDVDSSSGVDASLENDGPRQRPRTRALGGTIPGTRAVSNTGVVSMRRTPSMTSQRTHDRPARKVKRGKKSTKK